MNRAVNRAENAALNAVTTPPAVADDDLPAPPPELVLTDPEQLKAMGDGLRMRLVEVMSRRPRHGWSVKELAEATGHGQTKLYHHVNLLVSHGIIRVAGTHLVSGIVERRYQVSGQVYRLDRSLVRGADAPAAIGQLLDAAMEQTRSQILASVAAGRIDPAQEAEGRRLLVIRESLRLRPDRVEAFARHLDELMREEDAGDAPDAVEHGLLVAFYPMAPAPPPDQDRDG